MSLKIIESPKAPAAIGPYAQAIKAGNFLYTSGQLPIDMATGDLIVDNIGLATRVCITNIESILKEAGYGLEDVVKTLIFIRDMDDFTLVNEEYEACFAGHKPARSCVEVSELPKDADLEIEVVAYKE